MRWVATPCVAMNRDLPSPCRRCVKDNGALQRRTTQKRPPAGGRSLVLTCLVLRAAGAAALRTVTGARAFRLDAGLARVAVCLVHARRTDVPAAGAAGRARARVH